MFDKQQIKNVLTDGAIKNPAMINEEILYINYPSVLIEHQVLQAHRTRDRCNQLY
tara:strand:+ start:482 stop:646 length:165 start_codon:yes stop_codon:yes gene_type:complete